jgi:hypothetical protein
VGYLFNPQELVLMLESLGTVSPSILVEDGVKIFPCGVQCQMRLGKEIYRGNTLSVHVSKRDRSVTVDFAWLCIWVGEFQRWSQVGSVKSKITYQRYNYQSDEDRVKLKHILKSISVRFFRIDDFSHIVETDQGFVSRWYLPKMALFRMITIAMLAKK